MDDDGFMEIAGLPAEPPRLDAGAAGSETSTYEVSQQAVLDASLKPLYLRGLGEDYRTVVLWCGWCGHRWPAHADDCRTPAQPPSADASLREAFMAGITAVYALGPEGTGRRWVFEEDCLHPTAKEAAYRAFLAQRVPPSQEPT
jgi:hypothetical protein